jgi:plastocyanin
VVTSGSSYYPGDTEAVVSPPLVILQGSDLVFTNLDPVFDHAVTSFDFKPDSWDERLFETEPLGFRQEAVVVGVSQLAKGRYRFFCWVHTNMRGAFDVV